MTRDQDNDRAKSFLVIVSIAAGLALFLYRSCETIPESERKYGDAAVRFNLSDILTTIPLTLAVFIFYPVVGAFAIAICISLREWGHRGNIDAWDKGEKIGYAAIWPFTLLVSLVLYPSLGIINRLFRD